MNGGFQYDPATLGLKNGEKLVGFHSIILRLQQEINLSVETVSPTRLLFQYTKALSNSDKLKAFIAPKITYFITFLNNNGKLAIYTGVNIHGLYCYLYMVVAPTTLTASGQRSRHFVTSSYTNNDTETLQTVIADLRMFWGNWTQGLCLHHQWP